jgi:hypothetical protein
VQALPVNESQPKEERIPQFKNDGIDPEKTGTRYAAGFLDNNSADKRSGTAGGGPGEGGDGAMQNTPLMRKKGSSGVLGGVPGPDET